MAREYRPRWYAVHDDSIDAMAAIKGEDGAYSTYIGSVGDITVDGQALYESTVEQAGTISAGETALHRSEVLAADKISAGEAALSNSDMKRVIVYGTIEAPVLDEDTYGAVVLADRIDVDEYTDDILALTNDPDDGFPTYDGDLEEVAGELREDENRFLGLQVYQPDLPDTVDYKTLDELENQYRQYLGDTSRDDIYPGLIDKYDALRDDELGTLLQDLERVDGDKHYLGLNEFGRLFQDLPGVAQDQLLSNLRAGDDELGVYFTEIGDHVVYAPDDETVIDHLTGALGSNGGLPGLDPMLVDSPYHDHLVKAFDAYSDELDALTALSRTVTGNDPELSTVDRVKQWEYQRQHGHGRNIDQDELEAMLEKEIASKLPAYTVQLAEHAKKHSIANWYETITGETIPVDEVDTVPDHLEHLQELVEDDKTYLENAKRVADRFPDYLSWDSDFAQHTQHLINVLIEDENNVETAERLLEEGNDIYQHPANQEWMDQNGYDTDELTGLEVTYHPSMDDITAYIDEQEPYVLETIALAQKKGRNIEDLKQLLDAPELFTYDPDKDLEETMENLPELAESLYRTMREKTENAYEEGQLPDRLHAEIAEPLDALNMGTHFDTCLSADGMNNWSTVANAADVNKQVVYLKNEDDTVIGRQLIGFNEDGTLSTFRPYRHVPGLEIYLQKFTEQYADQVGRDIEHQNKNVETLVADDWYDEII